MTSSTRLRCLLRIAHSALSHFDDGRIAVEALPPPAAPFGSRIVGRRFAEQWRETGGTHVETTDDVYVLAGRTFVILSFFRDRACSLLRTRRGLSAHRSPRARRERRQNAHASRREHDKGE